MEKIEKTKSREFIVNEYLTVDDLAQRWKKNKFTIYRWKDTKKDFPKPYKIFGNVLFKIKDIIAYEKKLGIN